MTPIEAQIIVSLAKHGLRAKPVADELFRVRSSVVYHTKNIQKETGLNPFDFYDMCWLLPKAKAVLKEYGDFVVKGEPKK